MALSGILEYFLGKPAEERAPMLVELTGSVAQRDVEKERRERDALAAQQRRRQAQLVAQREPVPPTLRLTPEEQELTREDQEYMANVAAARQEIARDNELIDAGLPPFAVRPDVYRKDLPEYTDYTQVTDVRPTTPAPASQSQPPSPVMVPDTSPAATPAPATKPQDPKAAPLDEEGQKLQGLLQSMGAFDQTGKAGGANQAVAAQDPGLLSRLGRGIIDYYSDPVNRKTLAIGLAGLSAQPNRGYQAALQGQIEQIQEQRSLQRSGNATADYLLSRGMVTEAEAVRRNPALAPDILALATKQKNAYSNKAAELAAEADQKLVEDALTAQVKFERSRELLEMIDSPDLFETGPLANAKVQATSFLANIPGIGDALKSTEAFNSWLEKAENTEILDRALQEGVFTAISDLGIGARGLDTPAERKFLVAVVAGDSSQRRSTLRALLKEKMSRSKRSVDAYNERLSAGELRRFQAGFDRTLKPISTEWYEDLQDEPEDDYSGFSIVTTPAS